MAENRQSSAEFSLFAEHYKPHIIGEVNRLSCESR